MEVILRELYGEGFVDSPTAALTLKRVKGDPREMVGGMEERQLQFGTKARALKRTARHTS